MKLTNEQDAIKQAIEAGYPYDPEAQKFKDDYEKLDWTMRVLLDPFFWQALGRARGWKSEDGAYMIQGEIVPTLRDWQSHAMNWFIGRMSNGGEEKFWESLP